MNRVYYPVVICLSAVKCIWIICIYCVWMNIHRPESEPKKTSLCVHSNGRPKVMSEWQQKREKKQFYCLFAVEYCATNQSKTQCSFFLGKRNRAWGLTVFYFQSRIRFLSNLISPFFEDNLPLIFSWKLTFRFPMFLVAMQKQHMMTFALSGILTTIRDWEGILAFDTWLHGRLLRQTFVLHWHPLCNG